MNLFLDSIATQKQLYSSVNSQTMSRLAQSASIIQGQMAASQIPLCIVQDQSGQLHQLVYMVPEHLYQSYIAAAARGMKVNLPPKFDRLTGFLPGGTTSDASTKILNTSTTNKPLSALTEKVVKHTSILNENSDLKDKKLKINTKDILDLKSEILKGNLSSIKTLKPTTDSVATVKKTIFTNTVNNSTIKPIHKTTTRPSTPNKSTNNVQVTVSTQPGQKNDLVSKRIYTVTPNIHGLREAHFLTNELFPLIKTNKNEIFIKNNKVSDKIQFNNTTVKKESQTNTVAKKMLQNDKNDTRNEIDLTIKPVLTTEVVKQTSFNDKQTKKNDHLSTKESHNTNNGLKNSNVIASKNVNNNNNNNSNNNNSNQRNTKSEKEKVNSSPSRSKSIMYSDTFDSSTSIDDILSQNNSDLIPKSDVESLLKCLKRKLEEKEDAERAVKKANQTITEPDKLLANKTSSLFDEPADLFSSFDGSPESEEAPSPNFFFQSRDMGSVSSVDSALSYNQQSSVSSENSDSNANNYNFLDEILAEDKNVYTDRDNNRQNEIFDITNQENSNQFVPDIGLVDTLHNHTQDNIDFSFLDNLKGSYLDCDNIFDSVDGNDDNNNDNSTTKNGSTIVETVRSTELVKQEKSPESNSSSSYADNVSFPNEPAEDGDLFDHLWNELDNL